MESLVEISKILVPVDYSEYSILACRYALKIAQKTAASITVFHSFYSPAYDLISLTGNKTTQNKLWDEVTSKLMKEETKNINAFYKKITKQKEWQGFSESNIILEVKPGLAKDEIQKFANQYEPDLVIMGTRGVDKKENSILGSTTEIAIKKLKFPVIAIPEEYTFVGENNLEKILFLTDYDESDFISIKKLMGFARLMNLSIYCLHVGSKTGKWEKIKIDGLMDYFRSSYKDVEVYCEILSSGENILTAIDNYVQRNKINIISLTTRKRNLLEKVIKPDLTHRLFYNSNIPLMIFQT